MTIRSFFVSVLVLLGISWSAPCVESSTTSPVVGVLERDGAQRWRATGYAASNEPGVRIAVIEEEVSGSSKVARSGQFVLDGVRVLDISSRELLLEVDGKRLRLKLSAGVPSVRAQPEPTFMHPPKEKMVDEALPMPGWVRLTMQEYRRSAAALRDSVLAGGIRMGTSEQGVTGAKIVNAPRDGVLDRLGLQTGDVVVAINGRPAKDHRAAAEMLGAAEPNQVLPFAYHRGLEVRQGVVEITHDPGQ